LTLLPTTSPSSGVDTPPKNPFLFVPVCAHAQALFSLVNRAINTCVGARALSRLRLGVPIILYIVSRTISRDFALYVLTDNDICHDMSSCLDIDCYEVFHVCSVAWKAKWKTWRCWSKGRGERGDYRGERGEGDFFWKSENFSLWCL